MLGDYNVEGFVMDFERAVWSAIRESFPGMFFPLVTGSMAEGTGNCDENYLFDGHLSKKANSTF